MKTNIDERANIAIVVRGSMCEVLTSGAYLERDIAVKMTLVTSCSSKNGPVQGLRAKRFCFKGFCLTQSALASEACGFRLLEAESLRGLASRPRVA